MPYQIIEGDATAPQGNGIKIIVHCVNWAGGWGAGFVLALNKRWAAPREAYREWNKEYDVQGQYLPLGGIQMVAVTDDTIVCNLVGQTMGEDGFIPVRYDALAQGFIRLAKEIKKRRGQMGGRVEYSVHMPRIGAGLAGGDWEIIERLIRAYLVSQGIDVTVYDLPSTPKGSDPHKHSRINVWNTRQEKFDPETAAVAWNDVMDAAETDEIDPLEIEEVLFPDDEEE